MSLTENVNHFSASTQSTCILQKRTHVPHPCHVTTHVHISVELLLCVEDGHIEGTAGHVVTGPFHLYPVVARFCGVVFAENDPIFLGFALHLHSERRCRDGKKMCQIMSDFGRNINGKNKNQHVKKLDGVLG